MMTFRFFALLLGYNVCFSESKHILFPVWVVPYKVSVKSNDMLPYSMTWPLGSHCWSHKLWRACCCQDSNAVPPGIDRWATSWKKLRKLILNEIQIKQQQKGNNDIAKQKARPYMCAIFTCACLFVIHLCMFQELTFSRWCISPVIFSMWFSGQGC